MQIILTKPEKATLETRHHRERDGRIRDRIKAVLLSSEGWTIQQIAQAMRVRRETIGNHLQDWHKEHKLKPENGGSTGRLSRCQCDQIIEHLSAHCYTKVKDICAYVLTTYGIHYSVSGMTDWLHQKGFSYKQPKLVPAKLDAIKQAEFINYYEHLKSTLPNDEVILFTDATHPTMATKNAYGWILKGQPKWLKKSASKTRVNIIGAIELDTLKVDSAIVDTVNAGTMIDFLKQLKRSYQNASKLHVILDQAGYHRSQDFQDKAKEMGIQLHFLPPYSPNLNPIERLWKVMNEDCRNNVFFESAQHFRQTIASVF